MAKADALAAQAVADESLYNAGFVDGVASVGPTQTISPVQEQADIKAAVDAAVQPLNDEIAALQLAKSQEEALLASVQAAAVALLDLWPKQP